MTDPTDRNRLDSEASPYLQQHADNPVNWQPWDDAAFEAAAERDVPVFLSIGYSACHWCHVMAEESFEDEDVAASLNEHFVPVKVDREERPDVDDLYMTVAQLATGGGGWPLSVWLTPDKRPFYVGTYFPREASGNQPGFLDVLRSLHERWEAEREAVEERADQWTSALRGEVESVPDAREEPPGSDVLDAAASAAVER
ncbi:thioredoxin domain-containing protein, partial [Halarchaeum acidiphilum]